MKNTLVPPTQLVTDVPSFHHICMCTHIQSTTRSRHTVTGCSIDINLTAAEPSSSEKQDILVSRRTCGPTPHGWLWRLTAAFAHGRVVRGLSPTRDLSKKGEHHVRGCRCLPSSTTPVSKVLLARFSLVLQIFRGISPEVAIQAHRHLLFHKHIYTSFSCTLKKACVSCTRDWN